MNFKWSRYSVAVAICPMSHEPWGRGWVFVESKGFAGWQDYETGTPYRGGDRGYFRSDLYRPTETITPAEDGPGLDEIDRANANLIAAAPDLLAALENALYLADIYRKKEGDGLMVCAFHDIAMRTRKAIAKATGA